LGLFQPCVGIREITSYITSACGIAIL
jgi:hypothetical protein